VSRDLLPPAPDGPSYHREGEAPLLHLPRLPLRPGAGRWFRAAGCPALDTAGAGIPAIAAFAEPGAPGRDRPERSVHRYRRAGHAERGPDPGPARRDGVSPRPAAAGVP